MAQIIVQNGGGGSGGGGGGGDGDMKKSVYDPTNIASDAFDYDNFYNTPTIPTSSDYVDLTSAQNVGGTKTFTTSPVVPAKSTDAANSDTAIATEAQVYKKQDKLTTQTAYTSKGTASKVPQITTNTLGQVTGITEVNISYPSQVDDTAYAASWDGVTTTAPSKNAVYDKISAMDTTIGSKAADSDVVKLTGNQTINGTKTFTTSPVVPSKTTTATNTGTAIATEAQVYKKQDALSTQTAYTSKGTSTKVPTITTNTLGQVTTITETSIDFPVTSVNSNTGAVTVSEFTDVNGAVKVFETPDSSVEDIVDRWTNNGGAVFMNSVLITNIDLANRIIYGVEQKGDYITYYTTTYNSSYNIGTTTTATYYYFNPSNAGSTGNVLTKTAAGYEWAAASGGDAKVFTLSGLTGATALAEAQAAYDYSYTNGKCGIIRYSDGNYVYSYGNTAAAYFTRCHGNGGITNGTRAVSRTLILTISSGSVTSIAEKANRINVSSSAPASGTANDTITLVI